jgi:hypothetical protein
MTLYQRFKRLNVWNKFFVITSVLTVITFVAWLVSPLIPERPKPYPHFRLILKSTTEWPNLNLELTNASLFSKEGQVLSTMDFVGYLIIPAEPGQTNESLSFILTPDSPIQSDLAEIVIFIPKDVKCSPANGWSESEFQPANSEYEKTIGAKLDLRFLLPNDWVILPKLTFSLPVNSLGPNAIMPMHIRIRARGMPSIFCGFWVGFPVLTNAPKPQMNIGHKPAKAGVPIEIPFVFITNNTPAIDGVRVINSN